MESKRPHRSLFGKTKNRREGWQTDVEQPSDRVPLRSQERREPSVPLTAGASHSPTSAPSARREARGACRAVRGRGQAAGARASAAPDRGRGAGETSWRRVSWGGTRGSERYWPLLDGRRRWPLPHLLSLWHLPGLAREAGQPPRCPGVCAPSQHKDMSRGHHPAGI